MMNLVKKWVCDELDAHEFYTKIFHWFRKGREYKVPLPEFVLELSCGIVGDELGPLAREVCSLAGLCSPGDIDIDRCDSGPMNTSGATSLG